MTLLNALLFLKRHIAQYASAVQSSVMSIHSQPPPTKNGQKMQSWNKIGALEILNLIYHKWPADDGLSTTFWGDSCAMLNPNNNRWTFDSFGYTVVPFGLASSLWRIVRMLMHRKFDIWTKFKSKQTKFIWEAITYSDCWGFLRAKYRNSSEGHILALAFICIVVSSLFTHGIIGLYRIPKSIGRKLWAYIVHTLCVWVGLVSASQAIQRLAPSPYISERPLRCHRVTTFSPPRLPFVKKRRRP